MKEQEKSVKEPLESVQPEISTQLKSEEPDLKKVLDVEVLDI